MAERDDVLRILMQNANKSFVKRILQPNAYPTLDLGDGNIATHKMAWSSVNSGDGKTKYVVYPTVLYDGEKLVDYGDKALDTVLKSNNYIEFDSPEQADWFSRQYKLAW